MLTPESVVERQFAAYTARDVEAFVSTYAEDAVVSRLGDDVPLAGLLQVKSGGGPSSL